MGKVIAGITTVEGRPAVAVRDLHRLHGAPAMTAIPRISAPANRALAAAGLTTLEDVVREGRAAVGQLHGMGPDGLRILDEAVVRAGLCDREPADA